MRRYRIVFQPGAIVYHKHPCSFKTLTGLIINGARGRAIAARKHTYELDILFFKFHVPMLYVLLFATALLSSSMSLTILVTLPFLSFCFVNSVIAFAVSRKFFLSFLVKPLLDIYSIFLTYLAYHRSFLAEDRKTKLPAGLLDTSLERIGHEYIDA